MTTTINASTSSGLVSTADTSGIIKIQSNGVTTNALAWVNFTGSSGTINASYNVTSITRNAAGDYTVTFTNALSNAYYAVSGSVLPTTSQTNTSYARCIVLYYNVTPSTTSFRFQTVTGGVGPEDFGQVSIIVFGS